MNEKDKLLQEALEIYKKHNYNGIALLPTGSGKGRIMIELAKIIKPKNILYLCNTTLLRDKMFVDELHKWDASHLLSIMDRVCYQSAHKYKGKHYDLVLADEFDAALTDKYIRVFYNNTFKYKILVSATLDSQKKRLAAKIAPIIMQRTFNDMVKTKVLNKVKYTFVTYNLTPIENIEYLSFNKQFVHLLNEPSTKYRELRLNRLQIERKQFICGLQSSVTVTKWLLERLRRHNEKILIFCGLTKEADNVCKYSYHSNNENNDNLNNFNTGIIKELAVADKLDRGVNLVDVKHIIHKSIGRSKTKLTQRTGRGMRLNIDDTLYVYFLVPYFRNRMGSLRPTIVQNWVVDATEEMDLKNAITINYEKLKI